MPLKRVCFPGKKICVFKDRQAKEAQGFLQFSSGVTGVTEKAPK